LEKKGGVLESEFDLREESPDVKFEFCRGSNPILKARRDTDVFVQEAEEEKDTSGSL
jgi:hypothetical protein